jgi:hypothetical protein
MDYDMSANVGTGSGQQELVVMRRLILGFLIQRFRRRNLIKRNYIRQWIKEFDLGYGLWWNMLWLETELLLHKEGL